MKFSKKPTTILLMSALVISMLTPFHAKVSKAANYLSAPTLPLNGTWSGDYYLTETDDEHWYKIVIPSDGELDFQVTSYMYCYWTLYNSDLTEKFINGYAYGEVTIPETRKQNIVLSGGVYYLNMGSSNDTGKYKMYLNFTSYGTNDQAAVSYVSPLNYQLGSTITGALTETDEEDWYKIMISSTGYYSQKIVSYFSCEWKLYNDDLTEEIASGYVTGAETTPETKRSDLVLSKGTYYVQICSDYYYNPTGKYQFSFEALTQQNCTHDYDSITHDATYFHKGYTSYRCPKCGHTYIGNYKPMKKLEQAYLYSYSKRGKRKLKLSWSTVSDASGYQIRYSRKRNMQSAVLKNVKGQYKTSKTISKLARRKKYYVQVRAYRKSGSRTVYGKWSSKKGMKTK